MTDTFKDIIPSITHGNIPLEFEEKEYNPWLVNAALSYYMDCIIHVNMMNINYNLSKQMQYDYLFNAIRKRKRPFPKWYKLGQNEKINSLCEYLNISKLKAKDMVDLFSDEEYKEINKLLDKGGN